jgi:hypothetical protein
MARTLAEKLLIKPGTRVFLKNAPSPAPVSFAADTELVSRPESADVLLVFVGSQAELTELAPEALAGYQDGAALWLAYPKKSSKVQTDLSRDAGWPPLEAADFLPVTMVALDETWSALRFRRRSEIKVLTWKSE